MARSRKVRVWLDNGMHTRSLTWPGVDPTNSQIRSLFFRHIETIEGVDNA